MTKFYLLCLSTLLVFSMHAQVLPAGIPVVDDLPRAGFSHFQNPNKRSVQNPRTCGPDTVEYPLVKASSLVTVRVSKGRGLGQLYSCPKRVRVSGFTFYAFVIANPPTGKKMNLICRLYRAGTDSLPNGAPLRADTLQIDSTFGGGQLSRLIKRAQFQPIDLDSNYIIALETMDDSIDAAVVTNNYSSRDGDREYLNCGSISGLWYRGRNLNVGTSPFDCDILLHPYVYYQFGTDFSFKNNCYQLSDSVKFINAAGGNMSGSRMYNRYLNYNLAYICHRWDAGNNSGQVNSVDHKVKYALKQDYRVRLISTIYGYNGPMSNGCSDTTYRILSFKPDIPTVSGPANACLGDTITFTALSADTGVVYEWLSKPGLPPFHTGKTLQVAPVVKSDTFYLRSNNSGCLSANRMVVYRANAYPSQLTVQNDSVCSGSRANLKAQTDAGVLQWFSSAQGGLPFFTGEVYQTPVLSADTAYYVQANNNGCILSPRSEVRAMVGSDFAPQPPVLSADTTVCLASGITLQLSAVAGSGLSVRWFDAASGGSPIQTGTTLSFTPVRREIRTFYADAYNGVCGSTRVPVHIEVEHYPDVVSPYSDVVCKGDSARLGFQIAHGDAGWFDSATGGNQVYSGSAYTFLPANSTDFYIQTRSGSCVNPLRVRLSATVNTPPQVLRLWGDTICAKNAATLKSVLNGAGTLEWYDSDTSTLVLDTGIRYRTPVLNGGRRYYARPVYAGCAGPKQSVQPLVKPAPFSGFSFEVLTWQQVRVSPINAGGSAVRWDFGDGTFSNQNTVTHRYQDTGIYPIKLVLTSILNACKDSTTVPVLIASSALASAGQLPGLHVFPNPVSDVLQIQNGTLPAGSSLQISDVKGVVVIESKVGSGEFTEVDLSALPSGLYLLRLKDHRVVLIQKH